MVKPVAGGARGERGVHQSGVRQALVRGRGVDVQGGHRVPASRRSAAGRGRVELAAQPLEFGGVLGPRLF